MTVQRFPGGWSDVSVWIDGRLLLAVANGPVLTCYLEGSPIWAQTAPEPLLYCRAAVQGDQLLTVHQGQQSGKAWLVNDRILRDLGPSRGQNPVGIDVHEAYVVVPAFGRYDRIGLVPQHLSFPADVPPDSSQGFVDVKPDGTIWFLDVHRTVTRYGVTFTYPNERLYGPSLQVLVGQVDGGIAAACNGKVTLVIPSAGAFEPHVAVSPTGRVAICARTGQGAAYVATTIQELS